MRGQSKEHKQCRRQIISKCHPGALSIEQGLDHTQKYRRAPKDSDVVCHRVCWHLLVATSACRWRNYFVRARSAASFGSLLLDQTSHITTEQTFALPSAPRTADPMATAAPCRGGRGVFNGSVFLKLISPPPLLPSSLTDGRELRTPSQYHTTPPSRHCFKGTHRSRFRTMNAFIFIPAVACNPCKERRLCSHLSSHFPTPLLHPTQATY